MDHLTWLLIAPLLSAVALFFAPIRNHIAIKRFASFLSLLPLFNLLVDQDTILGSVVDYDWFSAASIHLYLKVDSLSLIFLYLTSIIVPIVLFSVNSRTLSHPHAFCGLVLLLQGLLNGFFMARDLALFTIFYEAMLLPLFFIINAWGGEKRQRGAFKFLIYMIAGSALMVAATLALYLTSFAELGKGSFNLEILAQIAEKAHLAPWLAGIFLLAFAVKTPLFPFHAWLPDAYCQAPTAGSILLAGLLSKAGIYGILRINMELFPSYMETWSPLLLGLAIAGVLYGGFAAWAENDYKRLIAYSSFSHVNFILAGLFILSATAHSGAILQAFNHGITITGLFLVSGWLEERLGTTTISAISGVAKALPILCWVTLIFVLSNVALPGTNNFIGELMILLGLFTLSPWLAALLGLTVILSVIYMLRWMQKVYFQTFNLSERVLVDIRGKEIALAIPLIALIFWVGIYPAPLLHMIKVTLETR